MRMLRIVGLSAASTLALNLCQALASETHDYKRVEVAFVLDSTGSMGDLIDGAKRKIWSIAESIAEQNPDAEISMALVTYRDKGDDYVVKTTPLSEDVQGLYGKLIRVEADGGGDTPESVNEALDRTISGLQWTGGTDTRRIVFLVGDAPPHMDYNEKRYPEILTAAAQHRIIVNAVQAGDEADTTPIWKDIAQMGNGRYLSIPQDGGAVVVIETPFDSDILKLQGQLDRSVVPFGSPEQKAEVASKLDQKAAAPASVALDSTGFYAKRSKKEVVTGGGDLVGEMMSGTAQVETMKDADLPDELKGKSAADREVWAKDKIAARTILQDKMAALVAKRDAYVSAHKNKMPAKAKDSFDSVVEDTLRTELN